MKRVRIATLTLMACMGLAAAAQAQLGEQKAGSLLPSEPHSGRSGTLSSWDTSPTGVDGDSRNMLGSPFPMAAAPAVHSGDHSLLPRQAELPLSIAGNVAGGGTAAAARSNDYESMLGSPFPMAADPARKEGYSKLEGADEGANLSDNFPFSDTATPFPTAAAAVRRDLW